MVPQRIGAKTTQIQRPVSCFAMVTLNLRTALPAEAGRSLRVREACLLGAFILCMRAHHDTYD